MSDTLDELLDALRYRQAVATALPIDEEAERKLSELMRASREKSGFVSRKLTRKP